MSDLLSHTGSILGRTTMVCRDLHQERPESPKLPEGADAIDWFQDQLTEMLDVLAQADPSTTVWGFGSRPSVGFWTTRMLIEVGIHRYDASRAWEDLEPLPDDVAIAGVDEFEDMWLPRLGDLPTVRFHAEDFGRTWVYGSGEPEAEISGTASDLYLRLMSRPSPVILPEAWANAVDGLTPPPR
jgi:uncharacterized protein (TIGR03083 family)